MTYFDFMTNKFRFWVLMADVDYEKSRILDTKNQALSFEKPCVKGFFY
jgi:hypothetical protein